MRSGAPRTPTAKPPSKPTGFIQYRNVDLLSTGKMGLKVPFFGAPNAGGSSDQVSETEDCLFLDIYVPASVLENKLIASVPVIAWFYDGAYVSRSKLGSSPNNALYSGAGPINAAKRFGRDVIFVAGNHRLGAFGWLAVSYVEKVGTPNAGLYDQRLLLERVQRCISPVGRERSQVSAWGESAGAGSILYYLVLNGGNIEPCFSKAVLQSPAYELQWDRAGTLNDTYDLSASYVPSCQTPKDIDCLRNLPMNSDSLVDANQNFTIAMHDRTGLIPFGPAVDRSTIQ